MKFLFTSAYSGLGGGEIIQLNLAEELVRRGFEAQLLVREEGEFARRWHELGQKVHTLPFRPASIYFVPALSARSSVVGKIADIIREEQIQIAHSDYHSLPYLAPAAKGAGIPTIWCCMGWWFRPKPWQYAFFRNIDGLFALSAAIRSGFLRGTNLLPQERMPLLYPGVDIRSFHPPESAEQRKAVRRKHGFADDAPLVLHVGRFQDVKGHDTFLELAQHVTIEKPTARFLVVGENLQRPADAAYQRRILAAANADPLLKKSIVYAGFVEDLLEYYASADVFVCPSRYESYGMANLEAMACGVPVVSTDRGGPPETVVEGETGFLVPPRAAATYAERVLHLLDDDHLRTRMGAAARRHVEENFSSERSTDRFLARCNEWL